MRLFGTWPLLGGALLMSACAEGPANTPDDFGYNGTGIAVSVAPLTLESLSDACYSFAIVNGAGELVVGRGPGAALAHNGDPVDPADDLITGTALNTVCASQFGNGAGGDASYVAPCDAQEAVHDVTLWVDALCDSNADPLLLNKTGTANWAAASPNNASTICTEIQPYQNPCGDAGCTLPVTCVENADTPVTFNFTIMGQADQGFFDIAVNFSDIFCSAKLDTCYGEAADSPPIRMLFHPDTGERIDTAVLALACTAGSDAVGGTYLHTGNVVVTCNGVDVATLDLSTVTQEGNQTAVNGIVWAAYFGSEALQTAGGDSWNKEFFNVAVGGFGSNCSVSWVATASEGPDLTTATSADTNTYNSYPYIQFGDTVTDANGAWLCDQNGLNEGDTGVTTTSGTGSTVGEVLEGPCVSWQNGVQVPCEGGEPVEPVVPPPPHIWATLVSQGWRTHLIGDVPPNPTVSAADVSWQTGHARPYAAKRMDPIRNVGDNIVYVSNAAEIQTSSTLALQIAGYNNADNPTAPTVMSTWTTAGNLGTVIPMEKRGRFYLANGYVRHQGAIFFIGGQYGAFDPPGEPAQIVQGMHFFSFKPSGSALEVDYLGTVIPSNGGDPNVDYLAMAAEWTKVDPVIWRSWFIKPNGQLVVAGPGFAAAQAPTKFHVNTFDLDMAAGTINTTPVASPQVPSQLSFHGFLNDNEHFVYSRGKDSDINNPGSAMYGVRSAVTGAPIFEGDTNQLLMQRSFYNFSAYNPTSGLWVGLFQAPTIFNWEILGTVAGSLTPPTASNEFTLGALRYNAIAPWHP